MVIVYLGAILLGGLALLSGDLMRSSLVRYAFRRQFLAHGLPPAWGEALALTESNAGPATNLTGGDLARGGSYGPSQISRQTARAWGYAGRMEALNEDPWLAAELTAAMVEAGFGEGGGRLDGDLYVPTARKDGSPSAYVYGFPASFADALSVWNSGRPYAEAPPSTIGYVARASQFLGQLDQGESA